MRFVVLFDTLVLNDMLHDLNLFFVQKIEQID